MKWKRKERQTKRGITMKGKRRVARNAGRGRERKGRQNEEGR